MTPARGDDPSPPGEGSPADRRVPLAPGVLLPESSLSFTFSRSGGPGGQNVNKVNTRATLTVMIVGVDGRVGLGEVMPAWALRRLRSLAGQRLAAEPERLVISSGQSRSQIANKRDCLDRLRELIVRAMHRPRPRVPTRPSRTAREKRLNEKKQRGELKRSRRPPGGS